MIAYTFAPLYNEYHENVLCNDAEPCNGFDYETGTRHKCGAWCNVVPVGIVNGRARFAVHTTTSEIDPDALPF
jgi:hypothetical protein